MKLFSMRLYIHSSTKIYWEVNSPSPHSFGTNRSTFYLGIRGANRHSLAQTFTFCVNLVSLFYLRLTTNYFYISANLQDRLVYGEFFHSNVIYICGKR